MIHSYFGFAMISLQIRPSEEAPAAILFTYISGVIMTSPTKDLLLMFPFSLINKIYNFSTRTEEKCRMKSSRGSLLKQIKYCKSNGLHTTVLSVVFYVFSPRKLR